MSDISVTKKVVVKSEGYKHKYSDMLFATETGAELAFAEWVVADRTGNTTYAGEFDCDDFIGLIKKDKELKIALVILCRE